MLSVIKIERYGCPICGTEYETEDDAVKCLSQPEVIPYSVGDHVYLLERYPNDPKKPFVERYITKIGDIILECKKHKVEYELDEAVQIGKTCYVGKWHRWDDEYQLALEDDFYQMGDHESFGIILSPETVSNWDEWVRD